MTYPTPHHERRARILQDAEEAFESATNRVARLEIDLNEIEMAKAEKLRELANARSVAVETEVELSIQRMIGNPLNVLETR